MTGGITGKRLEREVENIPFFEGLNCFWHKMKRYETIRVTPIDICLEADFVTSMPLDSHSVSVQEFEPVTDEQGNEYFDTDFEMY